MITMKGQFNSANIMIDTIDDSTREQIQGFLNHPAFGNTYIAIMPDVHAGKGAVVGFTMKLNDYIIPNVMGVDLNCGMLSSRFNISDIDLPQLDKYIKANIPTGFHINKESKIIDQAVFMSELKYWCDMIGMDFHKALCSIGTLGGGNHFVEIGKDSHNQIWVTLHSGSRNFGLRIANHFQDIAKSNLKKYFLQDQYKNLEFLLVDSPEGQNYLSAVKFANHYARLSRSVMMNNFAEFFNSNSVETIESVHNFLGDDNIIRKGATSAKLHEKVIIPFNMRDGLAICVGKGNAKYNFSAPHGAGRILSRTKAMAQLNVDTFKSQMKEANIYTTTATKDTLDEAPDAYKDMNLILSNIHETVEVIDMVKPIYNLKAGGD